MSDLRNIIDRPKFNMGSVSTLIYHCPSDDIETWPTVPVETADMVDAAKLVGNYAPVSGKGFVKFRVTMDTSGITYEDQGETDGMSFKQILSFFLAGLSTKRLGFAAMTLNRGGVFIVKNPNKSEWYAIGTEQFPAERQAGEGGGTGNTVAARAGVSYSFYSYANCPIYIYQGTAPTAMMHPDADESGS